MSRSVRTVTTLTKKRILSGGFLSPRGRRGDKGSEEGTKRVRMVSNFLEDFTSANRARVEFILTDLNLAIAFLDVAGPPPIRMWFAEITTTHGKHTLPLRTFWES